jgi:intracellular sulfur oxidation DsrE/DsrF family protein
MFLRTTILAIAAMLMVPALADEPSFGPAIARYLNMHARSGVPLENMDLAIVIHGPAVKNLLDTDGNPNSELIALLQNAGVSIYVCGQSMAFGGFANTELANGVKIALSAMTMLTTLQSDGYALLPWGA